MTQSTNPNYNDADEINASTIPAITYDNELHANNLQPTATITMTPGHTFQAQFVQAGTTFIANNGNMITFAVPAHNVGITADDDGALHFAPMGANPHFFGGDGA